LSLPKNSVTAALVLALTFLAGIALGVFGAHMAILHGGPGAEHFPRALAARLDHRLDLTDAQRAQVEAILVRHHQRINRMMANVHPQVRAEVESANREIERVLTPAQRAKFAKMRMRMHMPR
jgi:Spy/CpxP family protein refolding chaperone